MTLLCLLNNSNSGFKAFYVVPRLGRKKRFRVYTDSPLLSRSQKLGSLRDFYRAAIEANRQVPESERGCEPEMLVGVPQVARYLGQSASIIRRWIKLGMPVVRHSRHTISASPQQIHEWAQKYGSPWIAERDRYGRYARAATPHST